MGVVDPAVDHGELDALAVEVPGAVPGRGRVDVGDAFGIRKLVGRHHLDVDDSGQRRQRLDVGAGDPDFDPVVGRLVLAQDLAAESPYRRHKRVLLGLDRRLDRGALGGRQLAPPIVLDHRHGRIGQLDHHGHGRLADLEGKLDGLMGAGQAGASETRGLGIHAGAARTGSGGIGEGHVEEGCRSGEGGNQHPRAWSSKAGAGQKSSLRS